MRVGGVEWSCLTWKAGHGVENGESERFGEHLSLLSLCIKPGLTLSGCPHGTALDVVGH